MASTLPAQYVSVNSDRDTRLWFGLAVMTIAVAACFLAGVAPLGFSVATVFLFAGPHNWMEARYFMNRMPAKWGLLRVFFLSGILGAIALAASFISMSWIGRANAWSGETWSWAIAIWNTLFVSWIVLLTQLRSRIRPYRQWNWVIPVAFLLISATWVYPQAWSLGMVYAHPLIALWFLDRELIRHRPEWRRTYHVCLLGVASMLGAIWFRLMNAPHLPGHDALTMQIAHHAGASILSFVSSHCLVATHVFLEMLHYGVWLVAIPYLTMKQLPWKLSQVHLARRSKGLSFALAAILLGGLLAVVGFWFGFLVNYPVTRDIYFTIAIFHVLAEVPFLLRSL